MEHDYYLTLGVSPTATFDDIRKAFREKVMECHPDRGGSHERMVQVNEAWEVLSDPDARRRYDAVRINSGDQAARKTAADDARQAHRRAENYPKRWADVEGWLNGVTKDFSSAQYSSVPVGGGTSSVRFPTAGASVSGWAFILLGALLGGVLLSPEVYDYLLRHSKPKDLIPGGIWGLAMIAAPVLGGAWAGMAIHSCIGGAIKNAKKAQLRSEQQRQASEEEQVNAPSSSTTAPEPVVVACEKCGQKLRVPALQSELMVTCRSCGHKFVLQPA